MSLSNEGLVTAYDNVIRSGGQGIFAHTGSPLDFHDNHILRQGDGWLVRTPSIWPWPETHADLRNNWWGTDDAAEIAQWIWDGNDQPNAPLFIDFEPFLGGPVETEQTSWGAVKSLFLGSNK